MRGLGKKCSKKFPRQFPAEFLFKCSHSSMDSETKRGTDWWIDECFKLFNHSFIVQEDCNLDFFFQELSTQQVRWNKSKRGRQNTKLSRGRTSLTSDSKALAWSTILIKKWKSSGSLKQILEMYLARFWAQIQAQRLNLTFIQKIGEK